MHTLTKCLLLLTMLACAGCTRASDDARIDHILAGPHGWIDVTLHAPVAAEGAASAAGPALRSIEIKRDGKNHLTANAAVTATTSCSISFKANGETRLLETVDLAAADAAGVPIGYRFVAPAGALNIELGISDCIGGQALSLPLKLEQDQLALLEFDGRKLVMQSTQHYAPSTLDSLHGEVTALQQRADSHDATLSTLTKLAIASVLLNAVVILLVLLRRRA